MALLISSATRLEAWIQATQQLLSRQPQLDLILSIASPGSDGPPAAAARELVDAFLTSEDEYPLHTVAETIFPGWEYQRRGLRGVFETYRSEEYPVLHDGDPQRWGTYAERLLNRTTRTGDVVNPLKVLIEKMQAVLAGSTQYTSCYEIGIAEGQYDLPLYSTGDDLRRRRGGPCLSHLSFKLFERRIHLTAIYRSHDYRYKTIGNLLGLARLQACVAHEVGLPLGELVVHSTYAYLEQGKGKRRLAQLMSGLRDLVASGGADGLAHPI